MVYGIYSVRDVKTGFASPFVDQSDESAKRGFYFAFSQQSNIINFSPADFSLYKIGTFDSEKGAVASVLPEYICSAVDFINPTRGGIQNEE